MKKNAINNNTTLFAGGGAFLAWAVVQLGLWFIPEFVAQGGESLWTAGLALGFAWLGRQAKFYLSDRRRPPTGK